ncbi:uncharacterized protein LOC133883686 [Phragmites australis]|uniref:uncharacterized protein LOC133883686 n=1 Tax=Phragmites australis TaxID=29695 RepID=UPI002D781286|nr:uncharacterized protein LOC133883686 [Phragmites australis]
MKRKPGGKNSRRHHHSPRFVGAPQLPPFPLLPPRRRWPPFRPTRRRFRCRLKIPALSSSCAAVPCLLLRSIGQPDPAFLATTAFYEGTKIFLTYPTRSRTYFRSRGDSGDDFFPVAARNREAVSTRIGGAAARPPPPFCAAKPPPRRRDHLHPVNWRSDGSFSTSSIGGMQYADFKWLIRKHLVAVAEAFPSLHPKTSLFTHNDGRAAHVLQADGTIPIHHTCRGGGSALGRRSRRDRGGDRHQDTDLVRFCASSELSFSGTLSAIFVGTFSELLCSCNISKYIWVKLWAAY